MASVGRVEGTAMIGELEALYRERSLWLGQLEGSLAPRPSLPGDRDCDVAIVGAGFTGLWTAYYLKTLQPDLRVVVIEREIAGYGPSGRNGGWAIGGLPGSPSAYRLSTNSDRLARALRTTYDAIDEIGAVARREQIDCGFVKGGALTIATSAPQWQRLQTRETNAATASHEEADGRLLSVAETEALVSVPGLRGGRYTPHAARIDPARLVRALAVACERHGVTIYERSAATALERGRVRCGSLSVRAEVVIRATESYTTQMRGSRLRFLPLYSLMIATAPLDDAVWSEARLARRIARRGSPLPVLLRAAHDRRAYRNRRPGCSLPAHQSDRPAKRTRRSRARPPDQHAPAHVPRRRLGGADPPLGWTARRATRLEHEHHLRPRDGARRGRRVHRTRGRGREHLGRDARRPRPAPGHGPCDDALGRSSQSALGTRAAAVPRIGGDHPHPRRCRSPRGCHRQASTAGAHAQAVPPATLTTAGDPDTRRATSWQPQRTDWCPRRGR